MRKLIVLFGMYFLKLDILNAKNVVGVIVMSLLGINRVYIWSVFYAVRMPWLEVKWLVYSDIINGVAGMLNLFNINVA